MVKMKRKIHFMVTISESVYYQGDGVMMNKIRTPIGSKIHYTDLIIEYKQEHRDPLVDAYAALRKYVKENHTFKEFTVYYWSLEFI